MDELVASGAYKKKDVKGAARDTLLEKLAAEAVKQRRVVLANPKWQYTLLEEADVLVKRRSFQNKVSS
jgi:hypothetical protein